LLPETQSAFHLHAQRNAFRRRDGRRQSSGSPNAVRESNNHVTFRMVQFNKAEFRIKKGRMKIMKRYTLRALIHDAKIFSQLRLEYRLSKKDRRKNASLGYLSRYLTFKSAS
jgi:hypothetical protein